MNVNVNAELGHRGSGKCLLSTAEALQHFMGSYLRAMSMVAHQCKLCWEMKLRLVGVFAFDSSSIVRRLHG